MAKILVGITGSIAAYRSPDFVKELVARGHEVRVVLTAGGREFVSERALETFSGTPVLAQDPFHASHLGTDHIAVARWAELFVIYGATADFLARYSVGLADDFLCLQLIATLSPVLIAPAMNPAMWEHASVQENVRTLTSRGVRFVGPIHGRVACGESGLGHIAELREIVTETEASLNQSPLSSGAPSAIAGKKMLISAGPMRSGLDSVRFIQNRSSGKMGLELARAACVLGARVSVLLGPVDPSMAREYAGIGLQEVVRYTGPGEYEAGLARLLPQTDIFLSAAAVLDFEAIPVAGKIDRSALPGGELKIEYRSVPDFVARAAKSRVSPNPMVIAFAAEAGSDAEILARAASKLTRKGVDAIVANPVRAGLGPEAESNELWILRAGAEPIHLGPAPKTALAEPLLRALFDPKVKSV
jgi:phosphopantothenoylcysteine decarboxylase / phosphopantothenate---cysteine ligase